MQATYSFGLITGNISTQQASLDVKIEEHTGDKHSCVVVCTTHVVPSTLKSFLWLQGLNTPLCIVEEQIFKVKAPSWNSCGQTEMKRLTWVGSRWGFHWPDCQSAAVESEDTEKKLIKKLLEMFYLLKSLRVLFITWRTPESCFNVTSL